MRQREGKEREQILNEDGRDIRWMKEIWKRRERIEKEWGWIVGIIVIYTISGIKAILQDSSVKIADDEGVSPSSSVITRVSCNML
jgi:hypothetical protein